MTFNVTQADAYIVLYVVLAFFTALAVISLPRISGKFPPRLRSLLLLPRVIDPSDAGGQQDYFLSARKSSPSGAVALSWFASGMGTWILFGTPELGANPTLSWLAIIGYSLSAALPALILVCIGPLVRRATEKERAYSTGDFARTRYGRLMQLTTAVMSLFYMFIFLCSEMTAISSVFSTLTNNYSKKYMESITISIGVFTIFYTTIAGLPASIISDKFQAVMIIALIIILFSAVMAVPENRVSPSQFKKVSNWTVDGLIVGITICIAVVSAELFDQGLWQRVWAAESDKAIQRGFFISSAMAFFVMMFFGIMGMIGYAKDPASYDSYYKYSYLSFFDVLSPLANVWHILLLILTCALSSSTIDTLQNALTSLFSHDLVKLGYNPLIITRILVIGINIPAIIISTYQLDIISLFLIADLVCATAAAPLFLGLQTKDALRGFLPAPTELGALCGCIAGVATVVVNGYINGVNDTSPFQYFWLKNGAACALCGTKTMITFILTPTISGIITYIFSFMDIKIRGERARRPIITLRFDQKKPSDVVNEDAVVEEGGAGDSKKQSDLEIKESNVAAAIPEATIVAYK